MDLLTNPWVIIIIILSVVIGNIAALKYTAKMKFGQMEKKDEQGDPKKPSENNEQDPHQ